MRLLTFAVSALLLFAQPSVAADECPANGTKIPLVSFARAFAVLKKIPTHKGEFETSDAFQARVASLTKSTPSQFYLRISDQSKSQYSTSTVQNGPLFDYDADAQELKITIHASEPDVRWFSVFGHSGIVVDYNQGSHFYRYDHTNNIALSISDEQFEMGGYLATNGFGALTKVRTLLRITNGVFEREAAIGESLFSDNDSSLMRENAVSPAIFRLAAAPARAKEMIKSLHAFVLVQPASPYWASGEGGEDATFNLPHDVRQTINIMIADIKCVGIVDGQSKVLGSLATR